MFRGFSKSVVPLYPLSGSQRCPGKASPIASHNFHIWCDVNISIFGLTPASGNGCLAQKYAPTDILFEAESN